MDGEDVGGIQNLKNYEERDANGNYDDINIKGSNVNINAYWSTNFDGTVNLPYTTYWNGQYLSHCFNYNYSYPGDPYQYIYITNNNGNYMTYSDPLTNLHISFESLERTTYGEIHVFQTAEEFSYSLVGYDEAREQMLFNKAPDLQPNKKYFVFCNGYVFIWKEINDGILV